MPKATVATMTSARSLRNASWFRLRSASGRAAWYGRAGVPIPVSQASSASTFRRDVQYWSGLKLVCPQ